MERMQEQTDPFEQVIISGMEYEMLAIKCEPEEKDMLDDIFSEEQKHQEGMEFDTEVKMEFDDEMLISDINVEEQNLDPLEDHTYSMPQDGNNSSSLPANLEESFVPFKYVAMNMTSQLPTNCVEIPRCELCDIKYAYPEMLDWHLTHCHGTEAIVTVTDISGNHHNYQCNLCYTLFKVENQVIDHLHYEHQYLNLPYHCDNCDKSFTLRSERRSHQQVCSSMKGLSEYRKCDECDNVFSFPELMAWHDEHCHGNNRMVNVVKVGVHSYIFQCVSCGQVFNQIQNIILHLYAMHQLKNLPFRCDFCNEQFIRKKQLVDHQLGCMEKKKQTQPQKIISSQPQAQDADEIITSEMLTIKLDPKENQTDQEPDGVGLRKLVRKPVPNFLKCGHCGGRYAHREMLTWHIVHCHGPDPKIQVVRTGGRGCVFRCVACKAESRSNDWMVHHLRDQHQLSELPFPCKVCKCYQFTKMSMLQRHQRKCKKKNRFIGDQLPACQIYTAPPKLAECRVLLPRLLECGMCRFYTDNITDLVSHLQAHFASSDDGKSRRNSAICRLQCAECNLEFCYPETMTWHIKNCHGSDAIVKLLKIDEKRCKYQCKLCDAVCETLKSIVHHLRTQHRLRKLPFLCDLCDRSFPNNIDLQNHRPLCNGKKNYKIILSHTCKLCGHAFDSEMKMNQHISDIHGQLRYKCENCNESFNLFAQLKSHCQLKHAEKYISQCELCSAVFSTPENYKIHRKYKHKNIDFTCKLCDATFIYVNSLRRHVRNVHSKMSWPCNYCSAKYKGESYLKHHVRKKHARPLYCCTHCKYVTDVKKSLTDHLSFYCNNLTSPKVKEEVL